MIKDGDELVGIGYDSIYLCCCGERLEEPGGRGEGGEQRPPRSENIIAVKDRSAVEPVAAQLPCSESGERKGRDTFGDANKSHQMVI